MCRVNRGRVDVSLRGRKHRTQLENITEGNFVSTHNITPIILTYFLISFFCLLSQLAFLWRTSFICHIVK